MTANAPVASRRSNVGNVVRVSLGNFFEMYDFMVFGYYASAIARTFFPSSNPFASLMLAFMTFGAGYIMRPLGAIVLGSYIDHHGRRKGLVLTLALIIFGGGLFPQPGVQSRYAAATRLLEKRNASLHANELAEKPRADWLENIAAGAQE